MPLLFGFLFCAPEQFVGPFVVGNHSESAGVNSLEPAVLPLSLGGHGHRDVIITEAGD